MKHLQKRGRLAANPRFRGRCRCDRQPVSLLAHGRRTDGGCRPLPSRVHAALEDAAARTLVPDELPQKHQPHQHHHHHHPHGVVSINGLGSDPHLAARVETASAATHLAVTSDDATTAAAAAIGGLSDGASPDGASTRGPRALDGLKQLLEGGNGFNGVGGGSGSGSGNGNRSGSSNGTSRPSAGASAAPGAAGLVSRTRRRQAQRQQALARLTAQQHRLDNPDPRMDRLIAARLRAPARWMADAAAARETPPPSTAKQQLPAAVLADLPKMTGDVGAKLFADLARGGSFHAALQLLEGAVGARRHDLLSKVSHKSFLRAAADAGAVREALCYAALLPAQYMDARAWNMVLGVCRAAGDVRSASNVLDVMNSRGAEIDAIHRSTMINVAAAAGDIATAFRHYGEAKTAAAAAGHRAGTSAAGAGSSRLDGQVFGCVVAACAAAMGDHCPDRKEQLVLLERAFGVVGDAMALNVPLESAAWNALLLCAARCTQLRRAFEVLDMMQSHGASPDVVTYGTLVDACNACGEPDMALRVFRRAASDGHTDSVQLYTSALNACMRLSDWEAATDVYARMQRAHVRPDDLVYGHLIVLAGRAGRLEDAFGLLEDMAAEGLAPGSATASGLVYACLSNDDLPSARKVYEMMRDRGVYPCTAQYNALMEQYALAFRLGDVVALLGEMVGLAGLAPNPNTYRVLVIAAVRADQPELAYELYSRLKARGLPLRGPTAQSLCFTLLKGCFNRIREGWVPGGYPPTVEQAAAQPHHLLSRLSGHAPQLARALLAALQPPHGPGSAPPQRHTFLDNADTINWGALALATYREFISRGIRPTLSCLDMLLSCMRIKATPPEAAAAAAEGEAPSAAGARDGGDASASASAGGMSSATAQLLRDLQREMDAMRGEERPYEQPFDARALDAVGEAVARGMLPVFKTDEPFMVDMRQLPPTVAEAYTLHILTTLEQRRAANARMTFNHPIKLLVPPFDPNYIMWPSCVEKENLHYDIQLLERQRELREEAEAAREGGGVGGANASAAYAALLSSLEEEEGPEQGGGGGGGVRGGELGAASRGAGRGAGRLSARSSADSVDSFDSWEEERTVATTEPCDHSQSQGDVTGLGVAATLFRAKAYARIDAARGELLLTRTEVNRWVSRKVAYEAARRSAGAGAGAGAVPSGGMGGGGGGGGNGARPEGARLAAQARNIRLGMRPAAAGAPGAAAAAAAAAPSVGLCFGGGGGTSGGWAALPPQRPTLGPHSLLRSGEGGSAAAAAPRHHPAGPDHAAAAGQHPDSWANGEDTLAASGLAAQQQQQQQHQQSTPAAASTPTPVAPPTPTPTPTPQQQQRRAVVAAGSRRVVPLAAGKLPRLPPALRQQEQLLLQHQQEVQPYDWGAHMTPVLSDGAMQPGLSGRRRPPAAQQQQRQQQQHQQQPAPRED